MAEDRAQYEYKSVKAVRGMEARTIAKWEKLGWELDTQTPGTLRTDLTFRRVKKQIPKPLLAGIIGFVALVIVGGIIAGMVSESDEDSQPTASPTKATSTTAPSETPSDATSLTPEETSTTPTETVPAGPLTPANNAELAALMKVTDYCDRSIGLFAKKYEGQSIRFDGVVTNLMPHGDYETRFDILFAPGSDPNNPHGAAFKYEDVNTSSDLHWTGPKQPNYVKFGTKLRLTAEVVEFNRQQCLFFLHPVSTQGR